MPLVTARVITAKVVAAFHEQFESFVIIYMGELLPSVCQCQDLPSSAISVVRIERDIFRSLENTHSFMKQIKEGDKEDSVYM